jgi:lipopolysaccharide/colanic/teichoic acid biosynthesis glycosyltransferase
VTSSIQVPSNTGFATEIAGSVSLWNRSKGKRLFDLCLAIFSSILLSPIILVVAFLVRLTSPGPVLYSQWRMGRDGREFRLFKFRTMTHAPDQQGPSVTRAKDPRITPTGHILRKWKLDELPQLCNVIRGDMSFVGPRPDVSKYLAHLDEAQNEVLSLRPGLTGSASLRYRNEEQLLARVPVGDLEHFYCTRILPDKIRLDLDYARKAGFLSDLGILLRTFAVILS